MPTYGYKCTSCHHELEAFQGISEAPLVECPMCKEKTLQRGFGGGYLMIRAQGSTLPQTASKCCPCGKGSCKK